jgi:predicted nucleic acid-binding protein
LLIFDSDVLIWFARGDETAARLVDSEPARGLSAVALMELLQGARSQAEMKQTRQFLAEQQFRVLPLTESIGYRAVSLIEQFAHSDGLRVADAIIAATALEYGARLATANERHFRMIAGLTLRRLRRSSASARTRLE